MSWDIGPNLAAILGPVAAVAILWVKSTLDQKKASAERAAATQGLHEKIEDVVAPAVGGAASPPPSPPVP